MATPYKSMTPEQKKKAHASNKKWKNKNPEKKAEYKRKHYQENRDKYLELERERYYNQKYGISISDYNAMLEKQNNKCAICGSETYVPDKTKKKFKYFAVDHCHITGKVRGLLCLSCNNLLGKYEKHKEKVAQYLKQTI